MARVAAVALLLMGVSSHDSVSVAVGAVVRGGGAAGLLRPAGAADAASAAGVGLAAGAAGLPALDEGEGAMDALLGSPPVSAIESVICSFPWPCQEALAVAQCESRLDPGAVGRYGERGLFQVWPEMWGPVPSDPAGQAAQAYAIWREHGWGPWSCRPR